MIGMHRHNNEDFQEVFDKGKSLAHELIDVKGNESRTNEREDSIF